MATTNPKILDRFRLDGQVALVTGAAQGIGKSFAEALGQAGAKVALVDLNLGLAEETAQELGKMGLATIALKADVTRSADVDQMVSKVVQHFGKLTIGVNNAGVGQWIDAEKFTDEEWRKTLSINLDGVFYCCRAEGRVMLSAGRGSIINTASMSGHIANTPQNQAAYNASKAAVIHLTRTLAVEWASRGVRVNSISPGYTRTKLVDDLLATPIGKSMLPRWMPLIPMGRMATVEDLQGALVYLASSASDYVTGSDIVIDGGYCCW
ncbi:MAG TPA: glucose 1-dehydrogenase [Anaeromyxobacter sp.]|nr:glucose 1-dehydrogenase [Anaeromyxobacter sp.]